MGPFILPSTVLAMLLTLLTSGVRDLASCISSDTYWRSKNVAVSVEQLTHELDPVKPADISRLIGDLDADDPKARDEATAKIAAVGPAAVPALTESARNGSPEVVARCNALLAKIRAGAKGAAVRRLMAIRTLGEKKEAAALPVLRSLAESKEMFEADYANAAIAKIEGKAYTTPAATEAERTADVALLPSRLDIVAQLAPQFDGELSIESMLSAMPMPEDQKTKARDEANGQILKLLETLGNVRLNSITWGFYAAPPGQPGNTVVIARGLFDQTTVSAAIGQGVPNAKKVNGIDVYQIDDDSAVLLPGDGRVIFLAREPTGELGLEAMTLALRKGAGDLTANADLPGLIKTVDAKAPLWGVMKMASGLKEIVGPLGDFDTVTLVATQSKEKDKIVTNLNMQGVASDAAKVKQVVDQANAEIKQAIEQGRKEQANLPFIKPIVDFAETLKVTADNGKATLTGSLRDMPMLGAFMAVGRTEMIAPNPAPQPRP